MSVNNGKWSAPFSLETAGTTGMIQCKDENRTYNVITKLLNQTLKHYASFFFFAFFFFQQQFLMRITMSNSSRAKLITFAPFLSVVNQLDDQVLFIREWHKNEKYVSNFDWKAIESSGGSSKVDAL